jgi:hypothetical protein
MFNYSFFHKHELSTNDTLVFYLSVGKKIVKECLIEKVRPFVPKAKIMWPELKKLYHYIDPWRCIASHQKVSIAYKKVVQLLGEKLCMGNKSRSNYD